MARKLIHVLNGDGMANAFKESAIPYDEIVIWREGFALGPVDNDILQPENITRRKLFWETYSNIEENLPDYYKFALPELVKVASIENSTIFLWFEHDLFCQINLLFALSLIRTGNHVFAISTDSFPGFDDFKGYGQLNPDQLISVFNSNSVQLGIEEITFANQVLINYTEKTPLNLQILLQTQFPEHLSLLKPALSSHLKRFPSTYNGLGIHEHSFLEMIHESNPTKQELVKESLLSDSVFGFGDLEFFKILENLSNYISYDTRKLSLNDAGEKLLTGESDFWDVEHTPKWIGGTMISNNFNNIRWDLEASRVVDLSTW